MDGLGVGSPIYCASQYVILIIFSFNMPHSQSTSNPTQRNIEMKLNKNNILITNEYLTSKRYFRPGFFKLVPDDCRTLYSTHLIRLHIYMFVFKKSIYCNLIFLIFL